jgi:hypothetical protein
MSTVKCNTITSTTGKTLLDSSGSVIAVTTFTNNTRTALSGSTDRTLWSVGNVTKKIANSKLIIMANLPMRGGNSYFMGEWWQIGASGKRYDGITQMGYASDAGDRSAQFGWYVLAEYSSSEVGSLAVTIGHTSANGGSDLPASQWNPSSADDPRIQGTKTSTCVIFEVVN